MKPSDLWRQFVKLVPALLVMYIPAVIFIFTLFVVYLIRDIPFGIFFEDPAASLEYSGLSGLVSNMGVLLQSAAAAVCIFGYILLRKQGRADGGTSFLLSFGLFAALLLIDDFFLVHESIGNLFGWGFGISDNYGEGLTFIVYILLFIYIGLKSRAVIYRTEYLLLCGAIVLFGLSVLIDLSEVAFSFASGSSWSKVFRIGEEVIKFFAIVGWSAYIGRSAMHIVKDPELIEG